MQSDQPNEEVPVTELVPVSFKLPAAQLRELEKVAVQEDRTVSAELRRAVRRYLDATTGEAPAKAA